MKERKHRRHYSALDVVMLFIIGGVFVAVGIGILIALISSAVNGDGDLNGFIVVPIILFVLLPIGLGGIPLYISLKSAYFWIRENRALKRGIETTAWLVSYTKVSHGRRGNPNLNCRYSLLLRYELDGETRTFKTDHVFDINELRRMQVLHTIKVKVDGKFVAVAEEFGEDVYKLDPVYGLEVAFYKQPPVKITMRAWAIVCCLAIVFLFVSIFLSTTLDNSTYILAAIIALPAVNLPFAIVIAVFLIKWMRRK